MQQEAFERRLGQKRANEKRQSRRNDLRAVLVCQNIVSGALGSAAPAGTEGTATTNPHEPCLAAAHHSFINNIY